MVRARAGSSASGSSSFLMSISTQTGSRPGPVSHSSRSDSRGMAWCGACRLCSVRRYDQSQSAMGVSMPKQRLRVLSCLGG